MKTIGDLVSRDLRRKIEEKAGDLVGRKRTLVLFDVIENWKSPLEYEACMPLILEDYEHDPNTILEQVEGLMLKHVPNEPPPPYKKVHTVMHELCLLAIMLNDQRLIRTVAPMLDSSNEYVAYKYSEVSKWLQQGIKYPVRYDGLKLAYDSRS